MDAGFGTAGYYYICFAGGYEERCVADGVRAGCAGGGYGVGRALSRNALGKDGFDIFWSWKYLEAVSHRYVTGA